MEVDSRHIVGRKFLERCGFVLEAVLSKHQIVAERNRHTALYVILNSDWEEKEKKLKIFLGIEVRPKGESLFAIKSVTSEKSEANSKKSQ